MNTINIHVGAPKCMSTSIQATLAQNKNILYFGRCPDQVFRDWYPDKVVQKFFDLDLKYSSKIYFEQNLNLYRQHFEAAISETNRETVWLSSENLNSRFTLEELDIVEKLRRLVSVFQNFSLKFHIFFRTYESALISMYNEYVNRKYDKSIEDFLAEIYLLSPTGIADHILPSKSIENIIRAVGSKDNFCVQLYLPENDQLIGSFENAEKLSEWRAIKQGKSLYNKTPKNIGLLRKLNENHYNTKNLYNFMELHRYILAVDLETDIDVFKDRKIRKSLVQKASQLSFTPEFRGKIKQSEIYNKYIIFEHLGLESLLSVNRRFINVIGSPNELC